MKLLFVRLVLASVSVMLLSCGDPDTMPEITATERVDSFSPYRSLKVGEVSLQKHAMLRFGILLSVDDLVLNSSEKSPEVGVTENEGVIMSSSGVGFGSAAAIDRRGYFLTADHNVANGPVHLLIPTSVGDKTRSEQARVVWRGEGPGMTLDLALLHVPSPVDHVFEWALHLDTGEEIIGVGLNSDLRKEPVEFETTFFGGIILDVTHQKFGEIPYEWIACKAPAHSGDSGGPGINTDGQLIGLFVFAGMRSTSRFGPRSRQSFVVRPDLEWLRQVIQEDFAAQ